jgi:type I restriction enzyme S subunit
MSFPRYPKYKASGVEWLGDVPEGWTVCPAKRRIRASAGGTLIKGACADEQMEHLFPGFSASGQNVWLEEYTYDCAAIVLSAVGARCGKTFKADGRWGVVANTHCIFPLPNADRDFLWYLTNQEDWWEKGGSAQPFVKVSETLARPWVFPPLSEQHAIASFLDRETGKIDALVAEQGRLIELLKEKRQSVISHAVTKGLNPNAPTKPSGIPWLGDVPAHWVMNRLQNVCDFQSGKAHEPFICEDGTFLCVTSRFVSTEGKKCKMCSENVSPAKKYDTLMVMSDLPNGRALAKGYFVNDDRAYAVNQRVCILRPRSVLPKFLYYLLDRNPEFLRHDDGINQTHLSNSEFLKPQFQFPPPTEQKAIVVHLDRELARFDALTAEAQRAIDLLQERRTALISAAVTGQIDVRQSPL